MDTLIGQGMTAKVFSDGHYAYKVYNDNFSIDDVKYEVNLQDILRKHTDLNICKYDLDESKKLIKMSLIQGKSLADRMKEDGYKDWLDDLIKLQVEIYQYQDLPIPSAFEVYEKRINHSKKEQYLIDAARTSFNSIERKHHLCHLDFHPLNILYDGKAYTVIDWVNAKNANPVMDIARTYVIFKQYLKRQANRYLRTITEKIGVDINEVKKAIPLMAFMRLDEHDGQDAFKEDLITMITSNNP